MLTYIPNINLYDYKLKHIYSSLQTNRTPGYTRWIEEKMLCIKKCEMFKL